MIVWDIARAIGGIGGTALVVLAAVYFFPGSPLRRLVERWIDKRVEHRFDKAVEQFRHQLALDAERIRAEHQRLLHNAAIVAERKHEVFRELFRLIHVATGAVAGLFGSQEVPTFKDHDVEDARQYLDSLNVATGVKQPILAKWDTDRPAAIAELSRVRRRVQIHDAESHYAEAWNYFLTNSLYLPEPISQKAATVFEPLLEITRIAKFSPGIVRHRDSGELKRNASDRLEELRVLLRKDLGVAPSIAAPTTDGGALPTLPPPSTEQSGHAEHH